MGVKGACPLQAVFVLQKHCLPQDRDFKNLDRVVRPKFLKLVNSGIAYSKSLFTALSCLPFLAVVLRLKATE